MRRQRSVRSDSMISSNHGEQGFWPSYADMMSAVALILFFLMLLSYVQNLITGNNLQATQELLQSTSVRLSETEQTLSETEKYLSDTRQLLIDTELELDNTNSALLLTLQKVDDAENRLTSVTAELDSANLVLSAQQTKMAEQEDALAAQQTALSSQAQLISQQDEYLKAANDEIVAMRATMQSLSVFRVSVFQQVSDRLIRATGDPNSVTFSDNGSLVLNSSVFFDVGSFDVKPEAYPALRQLAKVFADFLRDDESAKYVDSIVISGHTDATGTDENNRTLSTNRANAVLNYLLGPENSELQQFSSYFCAAGYGESRPIASNDTEEGMAANRRIEISITLRDDSIMDIVNRYLDISVPEA